jgi:hypothetical protein
VPFKGVLVPGSFIPVCYWKRMVKLVHCPEATNYCSNVQNKKHLVVFVTSITIPQAFRNSDIETKKENMKLVLSQADVLNYN